MRQWWILALVLVLSPQVVHSLSAGSAGGGVSGITEQDKTVALPVNGYNIKKQYGAGTDYHSGAKMAYKDGYLYRAYSSSNEYGWPQFAVFDMRDPENPVAVYTARAVFDDNVTEVAVHDKYVYIVAHSSMSVYDVSVPSAPVLYKGVLSFEGRATDLEIQGNYAYIGFDTAYSSLSFRIVDLSSPIAPKAISGWQYASTGSYVNELAVYGKYVYLSIERGVPNSFAVLDVSDPYNPSHVALLFANVPSELREIVVRDNYLYGLSWFQSQVGLAVLDVTNPANIITISSLTLPNPGLSLHLAGNYAYCGLDNLIDPADTLRIVDISDPKKLKFVTTEKIGLNNSWRSIVGFDSYVIAGGFLYGQTLLTMKLPTIKAPALKVGQATVDQLDVNQHLAVEKGINVKGGLVVGESGINTAGPMGVMRGGLYLAPEAIVGISTPTWKNVLRASTNNGIVTSTGTANKWQYQRLDGQALVAD